MEEQKRGLQTVREDILRTDELDGMFHQLEGKDEVVAEYKYKSAKREDIKQKVHIHCRMVECLLALLWLFGKRIYEILSLHRKDIRVEADYLYVRFIVQKKPPKKKAGVIGLPSTKRIRLSHPYTKYIITYLNQLSDEPETPLFPGKSQGKNIVQRHVKLCRTLPSGEKETYYKDYEYQKTVKGIMSPEKAWKIVKVLNPKAWTHLFRTSLATNMAEHEATEEELLNWFDWERVETAHTYVKRGTKLTERLSDRNW